MLSVQVAYQLRLMQAPLLSLTQLDQIALPYRAAQNLLELLVHFPLGPYLVPRPQGNDSCIRQHKRPMLSILDYICSQQMMPQVVYARNAQPAGFNA
jgi:hypothetical protein